MSSETYYTILECKDTATFEEIKRNYQRLIKFTHPDKGEEVSPNHFIKVNEAWNTLKDNTLRKQYDASLLHLNINDRPMVYAHVNMKDLNFTSSMAYFTCRCGQDIAIEEDEHRIDF